jgi:uncharacterized protein YqfA (UPF0365 family)
MTATQELQDAILGLKAQLAGKRVELAMARGRRSLACKHLRIMESLVKARRELRLQVATERGECYFAAAGEVDRVLECQT